MRLRTVRLVVLIPSFLLFGGAAAASARRAPSHARRAPSHTIKIVVGAHNVTVRPVLDASRSSSATIGSDGGTLSTIAADGSTLALTLPAGALAGSEQVTMTPLVSAAGSGLELVAGVQLAPAGLRLLKPAQLAIHLAHPVPRGRQVAFGYQGGGSQFGLVPLASGLRIDIPLLFLGGSGLARATPAQLAGREHDPPSDATAAWLQQLAVPLYQLRNRRSVESNRRTVSGLLGGYWDRYVRPLLRKPGVSFTAWLKATALGLAWEREEQLLGYGRRFAADERQLRTAVFTNALRKRWNVVLAGCNRGGKTLGALQRALELGRTAQLLGVDSAIGGAVAIAAGLERCAELQLEAKLDQTQATWQAGLSSSYLSEVHATAQTATTPLRLAQLLGSNQFAFASARTPLIEQITSWTLAPQYVARGCTQPSFLGFTPDPKQMYGAFRATLTVPADLFRGAPPPPALVSLEVSGADLARWTTTCPPGQTIAFNQPSGAMSGMAAVTAATPIVSRTTTATTKFSASAEILDGTTIAGYGNDKGKVTVTAPH